MISYERELDIDSKVNGSFKITGILYNVFRPQKTLKRTRMKLHNTLAGPPSVVTWQRNWDCYSEGRQQRWSAEENGRIHWDRSQNKYTNCKGVKNNSNFGQTTGIQEKLDTTCKQNAS
jgi:hypothetical protein